MKSLKPAIYLLLGALIGFGSYWAFFTRDKGPSSAQKKSPALDTLIPFQVREKAFVEDTAYANYFQQQNPNLNENQLAFMAPVDTSLLSGYVRNFKQYYRNGTFSFTLPTGDIERILSLNPTALRVYLGMEVAGQPTSGTIILTGVNSTGGDIYLNSPTGPQAIDRASPCPTNCPFEYRHRTSSTRSMLGRSPSDPQ